MLIVLDMNYIYKFENKLILEEENRDMSYRSTKVIFVSFYYLWF